MLLILVGLSFAFGIIYRLFPIFTGEPDLSQFFITEDGYLMLTVARNMALGLGMSVSEGTIPTNGVQPLATYIFTIPYVLTEGAKSSSLAGILLISAAISIAAFFAMRRFAQEVMQSQNASSIWSWTAAALWFVGPLLLLHSMNALETGLYTLMVLSVLLLFGKILQQGESSTVLQRIIFGVICGIAFLARVDAVFLLTAVFIVWLAYELLVLRTPFLMAIRKLFFPGILSIIIASPWLINNYLNFGSIMPISGQSQSLGASFGNNISLLPAKLFEHALPMFPVPTAWEEHFVPITVFSGLVLFFVIYSLTLIWRAGGSVRLVVLAYVMYGLFLSVYYGLFFGAPHFMSRYMAPVAPLLIISVMVSGLHLIHQLLPHYAARVLPAAASLSLLLCIALLGRLLLPDAKQQGHFQVVNWIQENVPEETWVGAVQTGTLGYWHDRTINLDGKVNPEALRALHEAGDVLDYVTASRIEYLADWSGIANWVTYAEERGSLFSDAFDVLVEDTEENLGVLQRNN